MKLFKKEIKPLLDLTKPLPSDRNLEFHYYRKASLAHQTDYQTIQNWTAFRNLLDSWFSMEELQDNQRLLKNYRIMPVIAALQLPGDKESKVMYISSALCTSLSPQLKAVLQHDEWYEFFKYLTNKILLDDEMKKIKNLLFTVTNMALKLGLPIKYLEQKIMLSGIHQAVGAYLIERKFGTKMKEAMRIAGDRFWEVAMYRTTSIINRKQE